jgi:hypothetical protein
MFICPECKIKKKPEEFILEPNGKYPIINICNKCSDEKLIEQVDCICSVCMRKLPAKYFTHYRTRIKKNGLRLRVNTNCVDCQKKESKILNEIKKENPPPAYLEKCPQCDKIVYEKVEDIPEGVNGTNWPWQCDHDHKRGVFRGYLCKRCNTGSGLIGDNIDYFRTALNRKNGNK